MRKLFRAFLVLYLRWMARLVIVRHSPLVIAISGSTRKTPTKEALAAKLSEQYTVRRNPRSHNTEIGLPLAVLDLPSGDSSYLRWIWTMLRALGRVIGSKPPRIFVLEYGVEHPGDMNKLIKVARPQVAVFTTAEPFSRDGAVDDARRIQAEQEELMQTLTPEGMAVINETDPLLIDSAQRVGGRQTLYAAKGGSDAFVKAAAEAGAEAVQAYL